MISDPFAANEATTFLEKVDRRDVCSLHDENVPPVIHYCQRAALGRWFINKYKLPKNFLSCDSPLLREPPSDVASRYSYAVYPSGERKNLEESVIKRNGFLLCHLIHAFNEAALYYKEKHCPTTANRDYTLIFHDLPDDSRMDIIEEADDSITIPSGEETK
jgi:hypothetical protein